jgi:hypothetical protein
MKCGGYSSGGVDQVDLGSGNDGSGGIGYRAVEGWSGGWWWRGGAAGVSGGWREGREGEAKSKESQGKRAHQKCISKAKSGSLRSSMEKDRVYSNCTWLLDESGGRNDPENLYNSASTIIRNRL